MQLHLEREFPCKKHLSKISEEKKIEKKCSFMKFEKDEIDEDKGFVKRCFNF